MWNSILVLVLSAVCVGLCLETPSAQAQACSAQLQNKIGDTISVTATLFTSDPNENGEGEPLLVSSSSGEINATINAYSLATPFSYMATATNESITGDFGGEAPDFDETCSITATVNPAPAFTPNQKRSSGHAAGGLAIAGVGFGTALTILGCAPPLTPLCLGILIAGAGTGIGAAITGVIAGDPPDPNFMVISAPVIAAIPTVTPGGDLTQAEADAFNALYANQAAIVGIGNAAITSANRAQGAHDAGNSLWETKQIQAAQMYAVEIGGLLSAQVNLMGTLHDALVAAGVSVTFTPFDVFYYEQQIAFGGFPSTFVQALSTFGADQATIDQVRNILMVQDINAASGNFPDNLISPSVISALQEAAKEFSGVRIVIKSGESPNSINPQSKGVISVAILSSDSFDATAVDVQSIKFGPNGASVAHSAVLKDVNRDGMLDLVLKFDTQQTGIMCGDTLAVLTGETAAKQLFSGADTIRTVGCKKVCRNSQRNEK